MKVLLVDDSKSARYALRLQLQRHGMTVETAEAAESALERVRDAPPDAIFMDHTMPGMNGFEALDILKANPSTAGIPVVMCTSNEDPDFIAQANKKGAMAVLSKATAPEKLADLLDRLQQTRAVPDEAPTVIPAPAPGTHEPSGLASENAEALTEERIRVLIGPILDDHAERLATELTAKMNERLSAELNDEAERLQKHFLKVQSEQAQLTTKRMINEVLPQAIRQQLEQERQETSQMVRGVVDDSFDEILDDQTFVRRLADAVEAQVAERAEQIAKRHAMEIAEQVAKRRAMEIAETAATKRVDAVAEGLIQSSRASSGPMYLLTVGAALVGVASAAVVFFLLS